MRRVASVCFALGLLVTLAGAGMALFPVLRAVLAERPWFQTAILIGEAAASPWLQARAPAARVGMGLVIAPRFAARELRPDGAGELIGLYRFPLHYRVRAEDGEVLIDQWVLLEGGADRVLSQDQVELGGIGLDVPGPLAVDVRFGPFPLPPGKRLRLEAVLLPDRLYSADLIQAELRLFRQPVSAYALVRQGVAVLCAGLALMLLGLGAELRVARRAVRQPPAPAAHPAVSTRLGLDA